MRLLLVEDEVGLANALSKLLRDHRFLVDLAYDGEQGLDCALTNTYDVLILDVRLPKLTGFEIVQALRDASVKTPVLLLTALDTIEDRVNGLDLGADDYLVKPFHHSELLARLRALTRRTGDLAGIDSLTTGPFSIDLAQRLATRRNQILQLTTKEFHLLELFMRNCGRVLSKEVILDRVWGADADIVGNAVENYVHFLRRKVDETGEPSYIETVRGIGYRFRVQSEGGSS